MAKGPEIPQTDSSEIEILIERLKQNKLERRDVELIERLLRSVLVLVNLLQRKNMSIKRLRDLIFGRRTEKRKTAVSASRKINRKREQSPILAPSGIGRGSARGLPRSVGRMRGEGSSKSRRVSPSPVAWCWRRSGKSTAMKPRQEG